MHSDLPSSPAKRLDAVPDALTAAQLVAAFADARAIEAVEAGLRDKADAFHAVGSAALSALDLSGIQDRGGSAIAEELMDAERRLERNATGQAGDSRYSPAFRAAFSGLVYQVTRGATIHEMQHRIEEGKKRTLAEPATAAASIPAHAETRNDRVEKLLDDIVEKAGDDVEIGCESPHGNIAWGPASAWKQLKTGWGDLTLSSAYQKSKDTTDPRKVIVEATRFTRQQKSVPAQYTEEKKLFGGTKRTITRQAHYADAYTDDGKERLIEIRYAFDPRLTGTDNAYARAEEGALRGIKTPVEVPAWQEYYTSGGGAHRLGSSVYLRAGNVPSSYAMDLQRVIAGDPKHGIPPEDPEAMRRLVDKFIAKFGGNFVTPEVWYGNESQQYPARAPYPKLPRGWRHHIFDGMGEPDNLHAAYSDFDKAYRYTEVMMP